MSLRPGAASRWVVIVGYSALLVILSMMPASAASTSLGVPDWLAHGIAYGIEAAMLAWGLSGVAVVRRPILAGLIGAIAFGMATESLQLFRPDRTAELKDLAANTAGAILAAVSMLVFGTRRMGRSE
ncbi:MAG: VanZ family protein [Thermoanaerobaculales bacterium]|nr:VanZ family protein [Thermoanaerobaculales bacterium]